MIEHQHNLTEYFRSLVQRATARLNLPLEAHTEFYLVNLLNAYRHTEKLGHEEVPLAIMLERAVHGETVAERIRQLQRLGDTALFVVGYFPLRVRHQVVNRDYYIRMGGGAYLSLASMFQNGDTFSDIYEELGQKFPDCAELLNEVRRCSRGEKNEDLLELYERWLETGDERVQRLLQDAGIPTNDCTKRTQ